MAIFVDADTKVIVQGLTGGQGKFHGLRNRDYGTQVVGGVNPKKAGTDVDGIPVFASVQQAKDATGATVSMILVPAGGAPAAVLEAAEAMGYPAWRRLLRVEVPLALPAIVAGVRLATVSTIGLATGRSSIGTGRLRLTDSHSTSTPPGTASYRQYAPSRHRNPLS